MGEMFSAADDLLNQTAGQHYGTILADPPWQFANRTGKMAPEHRRLARYPTMNLQQIRELPIPQIALPKSHLYLWVPNALVLEGLEVMKRWGLTYKTNLIWLQDAQGRRPGWPRRRFLLPQRHGANSVWRARRFANRCSRKNPSQHLANSEARTLAEAGRDVRDRRKLLTRSLLGTLRAVPSPWLGSLGQRGR